MDKAHLITVSLVLLLAGCGQPTATAPPPTETPPSPAVTAEPTQETEAPEERLVTLTILLGESSIQEGIYLDVGGDADTEVVSVGDPREEARRTGNGRPLPSGDGNEVQDYYIQLYIDDGVVFAGKPTTWARIEVEYLDEGTDTFFLQYDGLSGGPLGDGRFRETVTVVKTDSGRFRTAVFMVGDAYFANRNNGTDLRIADAGDGAETIRRVSATLHQGEVINVDSCGADPWDTGPDSEAIQECVDGARGGDVVLFTSGIGNPGYIGYLIDKTIFLVTTSAKSDVTFTSTDPTNHALLQATEDLKGFVVRLFARSQVQRPGEIDNITISHLNLDGARDLRRCFGQDGMHDGLDDNWGSWLPECTVVGDSWCTAGTLGMHGEMDWQDVAQNYLGNPSEWSTGLLVDDLVISNTECGTALALAGAASIIRNTIISVAGEHVHVPGCSLIDDDEAIEAWADGITLNGPGHTVIGNTIADASDIGITHFGGMDTSISYNTVRASAGNFGMFAGINIGPVTFGDVSGGVVVGNQVINDADSTCGGIHAGIDIGPHMWHAGCFDDNQDPGLVGNPDLCVADPPQPMGTLCPVGSLCQTWAHVAEGANFTLRDNYVSGAQVNYLIEGLDLVGTLVESGNTSGPPRMTDWQAAMAGCSRGDVTDTWGTIDRAAHHPSLEGWVDQRIHCER